MIERNKFVYLTTFVITNRLDWWQTAQRERERERERERDGSFTLIVLVMSCDR